MRSKYTSLSSYPLSFILIGISVIISCCGFWIPEFQHRFGMNHLAFTQGQYMQAFVQLILFQFLHGNMMHLLANSYFLYTAGPMVESRMSRDRFLWFFMGTTVFLAICLHLFSPWSVTIGISGFCMALLSYLWIDLYTAKHPMANQILIMLALNIGLGFVGNISFVGHFFGAVFGLIWWYFRKK